MGRVYYRHRHGRRPLFEMSNPYDRRDLKYGATDTVSRRTEKMRGVRENKTTHSSDLPDDVCCDNVGDRRRVGVAAQRFLGDGCSGPRHQVHAEQRANVVGGSFDFRSGG